MKFADWLTDKGYDDDAAATLLGVDRVTISRIRRGTNRPSWALAAKLKAISEGAVTADDFLPAPQETAGSNAA